MFDALEDNGFALLVAILSGVALGTLLSSLFVYAVVFWRGPEAEQIDDSELSDLEGKND